MADKDFTELDMRDEFTIPVYIVLGEEDLVEINGIKGLKEERRVGGLLTRKDGKTHLDLATIPRKKNYENKGIISNGDDWIKTSEDDGYWYAQSWDGNYLFVLRKYVSEGFRLTLSANSFSGDTSKWRVNDFDIVSQFMLPKNIYAIRVQFDHLFSWIHLFNPTEDSKNQRKLKYDDIKFMDTLFTLIIEGASQINHNDARIVEYKSKLYVKLSFDEATSRELVFQLLVELRNLFTLLIGREIGISQIVLNSNKFYNQNTKRYDTRADERENWFIDQSYLPDAIEEKFSSNFQVNFESIKDNFKNILSSYLLDKKLRNLISSYLLTSHFNLPVGTQIVTMVSGIDTYYSDTKYESSGKTIKKSATKIERLFNLLNKPEDILTRRFGRSLRIKDLISTIVDSRDYFVHGAKSKKFTSETDLIPSLEMFQYLYKVVLVEILTLRVDQNN